jgi:hypothetical protein
MLAPKAVTDRKKPLAVVVNAAVAFVDASAVTSLRGAIELALREFGSSKKAAMAIFRSFEMCSKLPLECRRIEVGKPIAEVTQAMSAFCTHLLPFVDGQFIDFLDGRLVHALFLGQPIRFLPSEEMEFDYTVPNKVDASRK